MDEEILTVAELTDRIKRRLEQGFHDTWVTGEVVGLKRHSSGHVYFTLKDDRARLDAVIFRSQTRFLAVEMHEVKDGAQVICHGRLDLYAPRGAYKIIVDQMRLEGVGALLQQLEELKRKLHSEGLFDAARKRDLPFLPEVVGIVTSPTSAAIRDMLKTIRERFPLHIKLYPAAVQGEGAAEEIIAGIQRLDRDPSVEVIIVGRGGGAFEDLLPFSDEGVVRAVADCDTPVISAVGHEVDFPLCDFAADKRAATPTAAANLVVPEREELDALLAQWRGNLDLGLSRLLDDKEYEAAEAADRLSGEAEHSLQLFSSLLNTHAAALRASHPAHLLQQTGERIAAGSRALDFACRQYLSGLTARLERAGALLEQLGPSAQLKRGYSVVRRTRDGKVLTSHTQAAPGDGLEVILHEGRLEAEVKDSSER